MEQKTTPIAYRLISRNNTVLIPPIGKEPFMAEDHAVLLRVAEIQEINGYRVISERMREFLEQRVKQSRIRRAIR